MLEVDRLAQCAGIAEGRHCLAGHVTSAIRGPPKRTDSSRGAWPGAMWQLVQH